MSNHHLHPHLSAGCWAEQRCAQSPQGWPPGTHTGPRRGLPPEWCGEYRTTRPHDDGPGVMGCPPWSRQSPAVGNHLPHKGSPLCDPPGLTGRAVWLWIAGLLQAEGRKSSFILYGDKILQHGILYLKWQAEGTLQLKRIKVRQNLAGVASKMKIMFVNMSSQNDRATLTDSNIFGIWELEQVPLRVASSE